MHIPDGYLSPQTSAAFGVTMLPLWYQASRRVQRVVKTRYVPLVALGAAFSFVVMMFNVPVPDGTTAHAVGAALVAVLLGPCAACIAVSTALLIQALFFGDGGLLAYPANAFSMAVVMPFVAYLVYRALTRRVPLGSARRPLAAAVGGYLGINAGALVTAVALGLQPVFFHRADGTPLYAPFHLTQTLPPMMLAHLTVAGLVEAAVTGGVVGYLQRANLPLLRLTAPGAPPASAVARRRVRPVTAALMAMAVMVALTPLGLLASGHAFGETGSWRHALLPGYGSGGGRYLLSALVGVAVIGLAGLALARLPRRSRHRAAPAPGRAADRVEERMEERV